MKYLVLVLMVLCLSACGDSRRIDSRDVQVAEYLCENNSGYKNFVVKNSWNDMDVTCKDGSVYKVRVMNSEFKVRHNEDPVINKTVHSYMKGEEIE